MRPIIVRWLIRIIAFVVFAFLTGVVSGRWVGQFIESEIEYDTFRQVVLLLSKPLGFGEITGLDSYLDTIWIVTRFIILPWMLLIGLCGTLLVEGVLGLFQKAHRPDK